MAMGDEVASFWLLSMEDQIIGSYNDKNMLRGDLSKMPAVMTITERQSLYVRFVNVHS